MIYNEVENLENLGYESINRLPILDSFIKETLRIAPLDKSKSKPQRNLNRLATKFSDWVDSGYPSQSAQTLHILVWWSARACWENSMRFRVGHHAQ